jgi:hypothetical protein
MDDIAVQSRLQPGDYREPGCSRDARDKSGPRSRGHGGRRRLAQPEQLRRDRVSVAAGIRGDSREHSSSASLDVGVLAYRFFFEVSMPSELLAFGRSSLPVLRLDRWRLRWSSVVVGGDIVGGCSKILRGGVS